VCKQLGFATALSSSFRSSEESFVEEFSYEHLKCHGTEKTIEACRHAFDNLHDGGYYIAGVTCAASKCIQSFIVVFIFACIGVCI